MNQETQQPAQQAPQILSICGGDRYEDLHRAIMGPAMRCRNPDEFMKDMVSLLTKQADFNTELACFVHTVGSGDYVDHEYYTRQGREQQEFSRTLLSNLALDSRNTALYLYNRLRLGGFYTTKGDFPYALQQFSDRALSFRPIY